MRYFCVKFTHLILAILILTFLFCSQQDSKILTYNLEKQDFVNTVTATGIIEAKRFMVIPCPQIWPQPTISTLVAEGTLVKKDDVVCTMEAARVAMDYKNAQNELESVQAEYIKSEADIELNRALLESQVKSVEATAAISKLQLTQIEYVSPIKKKIIELQIQRSELEKSKINKKLASLKIIQQSELTRMKMKIKQAENKLNRAKTFLDQLTITSPVDGFVVYAENLITGEKVKEGDALFGGMPMLKIPAVDVLQVKLNIDETQVKRIEKEQRALVLIDANPDIQLTGKVSKVASIGKPINRESKIKVFDVIVELDSTDSDIQIGLTTTCKIFTQTFSDTLAVPLDCVFKKDSTNIVYIKNGPKFEKREIAIGKRGDDFIVVSSGLIGGEQLALMEPPQNQVLSSNSKER